MGCCAQRCQVTMRVFCTVWFNIIPAANTIKGMITLGIFVKRNLEAFASTVVGTVRKGNGGAVFRKYPTNTFSMEPASRTARPAITISTTKQTLVQRTSVVLCDTIFAVYVTVTFSQFIRICGVRKMRCCSSRVRRGGESRSFPIGEIASDSLLVWSQELRICLS
jgi:hypothetical protein